MSVVKTFSVIFLFFFSALLANEPFKPGCLKLRLNTSNQGKFKEFERLFGQYGVNLMATHIDLLEIDADPLRVIAHKASQLGEDVIVEDTSLEIEGATVGINVRWLLDHLDEYQGRKAIWTVLLAVNKDGKIKIYQGQIKGTIVKSRGSSGFGFDPVFLPEGSKETLAQSKPDDVNARAKAVEAFMKGDVFLEHPVLKSWEGPWQPSE